MKASSVVGAVVTAAVLAWGFVAIVPRSPGGYVALLTAGTFGAGVFYGRPAQRLLAHPWRCATRWATITRLARTRSRARILDQVGWNRQVRRPIRSFADLGPFRRDATGSLVSHAVSLAIHLLASIALALFAHPWWALGCSGLGLVLHGWPCLLQIEVLIRTDELQNRLQAR